jgi:hypothetical protein
MTTVSWDQAIDDAHAGVREEMIRQVERGEIYVNDRDTWHRRLPDNQRTALYGIFPPILDETLDALLDALLANHVIRINRYRSVWGLHPAEIRKQ